jgi:hypothetical protein
MLFMQVAAVEQTGQQAQETMEQVVLVAAVMDI